MADFNEFTNDDDSGNDGNQNQQQSTGGGLRKQLEDALAQLKAERESRTKLEEQVRKSTIDTVFGELKIPEKVRKFYSGEADKAKILEWVKDNAEVFGLSVETADQTDSDEDKQRKDQIKSVQRASSTGFETGGNLAAETVFSQAEAKLRGGKMSEQELNDMIAQVFVR